jgi:ribonuclease HI
MDSFSFGESTSSDRFDYLLYCRAVSHDMLSGRWQFALEDYLGETVVEADDHEDGDINRLTLWAFVRGLEAIDGESSVTLLSSNRYVIRSLTDNLPRWRENNFVWEQFGRFAEVQNSDLWRRVDRALQIHRVEACLVQSRLISDGRGGVKTTASQNHRMTDNPSRAIVSNVIEDDTPIIRIDRSHESGARPREDVAQENDSPRRAGAPVPALRTRGDRPAADPLRRFLMSSTDPIRTRHGNRFTAADLAEN